MPCPRCRKIIDAGERYCPHCGADTDAMLGPWLDAVRPWAPMLPIVLVALAFGAGLWASTGAFPYYVLIGLAVGVGGAWWLRRSMAQPAQPSYTTEPLAHITSENGMFELTLTRASVRMQLTATARQQVELAMQPVKPATASGGISGWLTSTSRRKSVGSFAPLNQAQDS
jgi:hypothetical protein